ncbi:MAG TPA: CPBP family glutamic-type intramembrane protease [Candidatus Saccharimonadales bacterium]|nr:CPBP family glutamic-type intramembrane protease [Candidatus Saccharimonadales bacterium]
MTFPLFRKVAKVVSIVLLCLGAVVLIPFEQRLLGYGILTVGAATLFATPRAYARDIVLIYLSIGILGITPIDTSITLSHMLLMGGLLACAVGIPFLITRYVYKEKSIVYPLGKHTWTRGHIGYLLFAFVLSYLILPFWMQTTGGYTHWNFEITFASLGLLFIGTNSLGIWDELFFVVTALGLMRRHMPFFWANMAQAVMFTSFLYELGFRGWAPFLIFPFALLQGIVFKKTENLVYVIAIHLTLDLVLYLALINAHHPDLIPIFITR